MRVHARIAAVGAVVALLGAAAPGVAQDDPATATDPSITDGSAQRALDAARQRWRTHGERSYRMTVRISCFCAPAYTQPHVVVVRGGRIVRAAPEVRRIATVPRLFRIVAGAIDDRVARLDVRYDVRRGFPRTIYVDRSLMIADEEAGYGASRFAAL